MKTPTYVIAIDGPAASGKSTAAALLAKRLGLLNINTGAMYRAFSLNVLRHELASSDSVGIERLLASTNISFRREADGSTSVILNGEDVTEQIKADDIACTASVVSRLPAVRRHMVALQQELARRGGAVAEGRDTTTVVFPNTPHKFFIDASLDTRARRRHTELVSQGISISLEQVREDLRRRDTADKTRRISPLTKDRDAVLIDSTNLTPEQVLDRILEHLGPAFEPKVNPPPSESG
jgi:cytidylate kinase